MTSESFLQALGLPEDAAPDAIERRFIELVKLRIQAVSTSYDEGAVEREEKAVRKFHKLFFQQILRWTYSRIQQHKGQRDIPEAARMKTAGQALVEDLQKNIVEFAICYMRINRYMTLLRDEIRREHIHAGSNAVKVKANVDTGEMIRRQNKEKNRLMAGNARLQKARGLLERIETDLSSLRRDFQALTGGSRDREDPTIRSFVAALRVANFTRAAQVVNQMTEAKKRFGTDQKTADELQARLKKKGLGLIETIAENADLLEGPDRKLFLRVDETSRVYNAQVRELRKIQGYMAKYHLPYMDYKIDQLMHLKDKLLVTGSLENLLALYLRLMTMLANPLTDMMDLRQFENDIYHPLKFLLESHFPEIPIIMERAESTVREFRADRREYQELEKIELQEVADSPNTAA